MFIFIVFSHVFARSNNKLVNRSVCLTSKAFCNDLSLQEVITSLLIGVFAFVFVYALLIDGIKDKRRH